MLNNIKQPYGYKTFTIGTITIYSAKIRVKAESNMFERMWNSAVAQHPVSISNNKNNCVAISWTTTDYIVHNMYRELLNDILASIMHERVTKKYAKEVPDYTCL